MKTKLVLWSTLARWGKGRRKGRRSGDREGVGREERGVSAEGWQVEKVKKVEIEEGEEEDEEGSGEKANSSPERKGLELASLGSCRLWRKIPSFSQ